MHRSNAGWSATAVFEVGPALSERDNRSLFSSTHTFGQLLSLGLKVGRPFEWRLPLICRPSVCVLSCSFPIGGIKKCLEAALLLRFPYRFRQTGSLLPIVWCRLHKRPRPHHAKALRRPFQWVRLCVPSWSGKRSSISQNLAQMDAGKKSLHPTVYDIQPRLPRRPSSKGDADQSTWSSE